VDATDTARHLWSRAVGNARAPEQITAAAERVCTQLRAGLGRWIGDEGYRTLLDRAAGLVRAEHPALGGLACLRRDEPVATTSTRTHDAVELAAGMVALLATLIELLGRIISAEMAVHLVEQIGTPSVRGGVNADTERGRDG
jgi:hypothetical protein